MHLFIYVSLMKSHLIKHKHQVAKENLVLKKITASNKQLMRRSFDLLSFGFQWSSSRALQEKQVTKHTEAYQISTFTLPLVLTVTSELFDYEIPNAQHCWGRWRRQSPPDTQRDRRIAIEAPPSPFKETERFGCKLWSSAKEMFGERAHRGWGSLHPCSARECHKSSAEHSTVPIGMIVLSAHF